MAIELNKHQWMEILANRELTTDTGLSIFQALYSFDSHKAYASQIGMLLGYEGKAPQAPLNSELGRYAKRIAKYYALELTERRLRRYKSLDLFFLGWDEGSYFVWKLRPEIAEALLESNLTGELKLAEELPVAESLSEGAKKTVTVNSYERNPKARQRCIEHWGTLCSICKFDFNAVYGELGSGHAHVHHLTPVSEVGEKYQVDPIRDLRPVCPNCHSMLHIKNPPIGIDKLMEIITTNKKQVGRIKKS